MEAYFSCSYRDKRINAYFIEAFMHEQLSLKADQKSPTWCVAKIERHLLGLSGFVSVVPRRILDDQSIIISPYIDYEIRFARRAGVPRLLFVDDELLGRYPSKFPEDAVPFVYDSPAADQFEHQKAIAEFRKIVEGGPPNRHSRRKNRKVTVVSAGSKIVKAAVQEIMQIISDYLYHPKLIARGSLGDLFDDVSIVEEILSSELCVFLLDARVSVADVIMGMSYAQFVPSIRLHYDPSVTGCEDTVSGRIAWSTTAELVKTFKQQLESFRRGFVEVVRVAEQSSSTEAAESLSITKWVAEEHELWDPQDGASLINHVHPSHPFVIDEISRVRATVGGTLLARKSREDARATCHHIYNNLKRLRCAYEIEPQIKDRTRQAIRTPDRILNDKAATCLDLCCLFASLLFAAQLEPLILILDHQSAAHALVGYKAPNAMLWDGMPELADIRAAVRRGDIFVFEATGAVESDSPVGAETEEERRSGNKMLDFTTAQIAADRFLNTGPTVRHFLDVSDRT